MICIWYAVAAIATGEIVYCGMAGADGEPRWEAAVALVAGTCHGQGERATDAQTWARYTARKIRELGMQIHEEEHRF